MQFAYRRSLIAAYQLLKLGFKRVAVLKGGFSEWKKNDRYEDFHLFYASDLSKGKFMTGCANLKAKWKCLNHMIANIGTVDVYQKK